MADEIATTTPVEEEVATQIAIPDGQTMAKYASNDQFDDFVSTYLPRLQLFDSNSGAVKEGKINIGNYGLAHNNNVTDLGKECRIFVLSMRFKAMDLNNGVKSWFNPALADFKRVKARSEGQNTGCLCGPEFLVYVPELGKFATFFMSSKTMRREAPNVRELLGKAALLRARMIDKKPYKWWGPVVVECTTPMSIPPADRLADELDKFNNPPESQIETIDEAAAAAAGVERPR